MDADRDMTDEDWWDKLVAEMRGLDDQVRVEIQAASLKALPETEGDGDEQSR